MVYETKGYDTTIVYDYKEYPDVTTGAAITATIRDGVFLRECRQCGMKKSI